MKLLIILYILLSFSYGEGQSVLSKTLSSSINEESENELTQLRNQLGRRMSSLMRILLNEETPIETRHHIMDEIKTLTEINGVITGTLNQVLQNREECIKKEADEKCISDDLWIKTQVELIRRKHATLIGLHKRQKDLDKEFYINLAFDGFVILAGSFLFFVPAVGPAVSISLIAGRVITITGRTLGPTLALMGVADSGTDLWFYFYDEEQETLSFILNLVSGHTVIKEMFNIRSSLDENDKILAINLFNSQNTETLIAYFLEAIQDKKYSPGTRQASMRALKATLIDMGETTKRKVIETLKDVIDNSNILTLRETSVIVLGKIGEEEHEVSEYLRGKGIDEDESDKFRLFALIQSGRNKTTFPIAIELLIYEWIQGSTHLNSKLEIPYFFSNSLLSAKKEELQGDGDELQNYIIVLKELISLGVLDVELKLRFSEALIRLDGISNNKDFLAEIYSRTDLVTDLGLYVDNLYEEMLSEDNAQAFDFLKTRLSKPKNFKNITAVEITIQQFTEDYPNQKRITRNLEEFLDTYKNILETIKR